MKQLDYQLRAIDELVAKTVKLLNEGGRRNKLVFEAPTGAGKTVMACQTLAGIVDALKSDGRNRFEEVAFIWFAPRRLHIQSYNSLQGAFTEGRELRPVMFDDLDKSQGIQPGEILFVNWESVNKDSNLMVRDTEASASLYEICRKTRDELGLPIVAVIDEEHMFWSSTADKSADVLNKINPDVEIRISATPKTTQYKEKVRVSRKDVIAAGMIKREVVLNADLAEGVTEEVALNNHLMAKALEKREQLAQAYKDLGIDINPLLLIQLPNDKKESMTTEDEAISEFVRNYLATLKDISVENERLAIWLANEKANLDGLSNPDNPTQVLLFKEAIALGWDCPRAAVLLIFRKMASDTFTVQTVGRILRMPQQHHYTNDRLNVGYVYTDIAKDRITIATADADYIRKSALLATRRSDIFNITLPSTYSKRLNDTRNYFGPDFRKLFFEESEKFWNVVQPAYSLFSLAELIALRDDSESVDGKLPETDDDRINENRRRVENVLRLDVKNINVPIPKDVHFQNEEQVLNIENQTVKFARKVHEIDRVFISWVSGFVTMFENKNNPPDKLASYLLEMMAEFFGMFDTDAKKVILYNENRPKFDRLIRQAIERYIKIREVKKQKAASQQLETWEWSVPEQRLYDEETHSIGEAKNHALTPFVELNRASAPEREFFEFLEKNTDYIEWWYKNGDSGRQNYAIPYTTVGGGTSLFYVDFVIRLRNGRIFLFDTKSSGSEPLTAHLKHNALIDYITAENEKGEQQLAGGVIVKDGENWIWSRFKVEDTINHEGWDYFDPKRENSK